VGRASKPKRRDRRAATCAASPCDTVMTSEGGPTVAVQRSADSGLTPIKTESGVCRWSDGPIISPRPLAKPWFHRTGLGRGQAPKLAALLIVFALLLTGGVRPAVAALPCGTQPEFAVAGSAEIKSDIEGKADLILRKPASPNMRALVTAQRHALRETYPDADALTLDSYLLWMTCQSISADGTLAVSQKFDKYSDFYRWLSEPIKAPTHSE
jgi:hypothetical protein